MQLIVGLGNPGGKYQHNRHNIGFMALDHIHQDMHMDSWREKFNGLIAEHRFATDKVLLLKPQTYMNKSGQSVGEAMRFYKLEPQDVIVFHDELDLDPGKLRVKSGGGHAGHNGLRDIENHIGKAFHRIRIGIGHPGQKSQVANYVLQNFPKADQNWIDAMLPAMSRHLELILTGNQNDFAARVGDDMKDILKAAPPGTSETKDKSIAAQSRKKSDNNLNDKSDDGPLAILKSLFSSDT